MTRILAAGALALACLTLGACAKTLSTGGGLVGAPTAAEATRAACDAGRAAVDAYVADKSPLVQAGAAFGQSLFAGSCSRAAIASADAATVRKARRAERLLKRAKAGEAPDPADLKAAKAELAPR